MVGGGDRDGRGMEGRDGDFFIDNLLVRIPFVIEMIWWADFAPWNLECPFSGSLISTFLGQEVPTKGPMWGYPRCGLGAVGAVLEPFCGHLSPKNDKVS